VALAFDAQAVTLRGSMPAEASAHPRGRPATSGEVVEVQLVSHLHEIVLIDRAGNQRSMSMIMNPSCLAIQNVVAWALRHTAPEPYSRPPLVPMCHCDTRMDGSCCWNGVFSWKLDAVVTIGSRGAD
jgi:hypothetical protein